MLIFGIGLVCVRKPNASCDECRTRRTKCEYPGKTNVGAGSPTKGRPIVVVPPPKHESLEVRHQEVAVREQANELAEVRLEVDHDMVCAMRDLTHTMGHTVDGEKLRAMLLINPTKSTLLLILNQGEVGPKQNQGS